MGSRCMDVARVSARSARAFSAIPEHEARAKTNLLTDGRAVDAADLGHAEVVAGWVEDDFGHVMAHEQQAPPAGALEILDGHRIGHVFRIEAPPFVRDADVEAVAVDEVDDADFLAAVELIAVFDGVDECFFEGQPNAENFTFVETVSRQGALDFVLNLASLAGVAGDHMLPRPHMADVTHRVFLANQEIGHRHDACLGGDGLPSPARTTTDPASSP